VNTKLPHS